MRKIDLVIISILLLIILLGGIFLFSQLRDKNSSSHIPIESLEGADKVNISDEIEEKVYNIEEMSTNEVKEAIIDATNIDGKYNIGISIFSYVPESFVGTNINYWTDGERFKNTSVIDKTIPYSMKEHLVKKRETIYDGTYYKDYEYNIDHIRISKDKKKLEEISGRSNFNPLLSIIEPIFYNEEGTWELDLSKQKTEEEISDFHKDKNLKLLKYETKDYNYFFWFDIQDFIVYDSSFESKKFADMYDNFSIYKFDEVENYPSGFFEFSGYESTLKEIEY